MTNEAHTPGPWQVELEEEPDFCIECNAPIDQHGYVFAVKGHPHLGPDEYVQNPAYANNEANARLIAAAPDLLHSVRCCLADLEGVMPEYESSGDRTHPGWVSIKEACEVLTRATGELVEPISPDDDDELVLVSPDENRAETFCAHYESAERLYDPLPWQVQGLQQTATGYGAKLTTPWKVRLHGRLYRVYATYYSNAASTWFTVKGRRWYVHGSPASE